MKKSHPKARDRFTTTTREMPHMKAQASTSLARTRQKAMPLIAEVVDDGEVMEHDIAMRARLSALGKSGLIATGGKVQEEWNSKLKDRRGLLAWKEMGDQDPTCGTALHIIEMCIQRVPWRFDVPPGAEGAPGAIAARDFVESCKADMEHGWSDFVSDAARGMLQFGWQVNEIVYKLRKGDSLDPAERSKWSDGKLGWRKFASRAQETLDRWLFDPDQKPRAMVQAIEEGDWTMRAVAIPLERCMHFRYRPRKDSPEGRSIMRSAWKPYYYQKRMQEAEAIGAERDLTGMPIFEVPQEYLGDGATTEQTAMVDYLAKVVKSITSGARSGAVIPSEKNADGTEAGFKFRLMASPGSKQIDVDKVIRRYQGDIAMVWMCEFMLLGRDGVGSWALDDGKQTRFGLFLEGVLTSICEVVQRASDKLCELNGIAPEFYPRATFGEVKAPDMAVLAQMLTAAHQADLLDPDDDLRDWLRRTTKMPPRKQDVDPLSGEALPYARDATLADLMGALDKATAAGDFELANILRKAVARKLDVESLPDLDAPEEDEPIVAAPEGAGVQATALNGAQVAAMLAIVGALGEDFDDVGAMAAFRIAFPNSNEADVKILVASARKAAAARAKKAAANPVPA